MTTTNVLSLRVRATTYFFTVIFACLMIWAVMPTPTRAAGLTESQIKSVINLLAVFDVDAATVARVNTILRGGTPASVPPASGGSSTSGGVAFTQNLYFGSRGAEVTRLQQFLIGQGLLASDSATGYFGLATKAAVIAFQRKNGIEPFGGVGPQTRAAIARIGTTTYVPPDNSRDDSDSSKKESDSSRKRDGGNGGGGGSSRTPRLSITATPERVASGGFSTITWSSTETSSCTVKGGAISISGTSGSTQTGALTQDTTFTLSCEDESGSKTYTERVEVDVTASILVPTLSITATPSTVAYNTSSVITWAASNVSSCSVSGPGVNATGLTGSKTTPPLTGNNSVYTAVCDSLRKSVLVSVGAPLLPRCTLSLSASSIVAGQSTTLSWSTTNATSLSINQGIGSVPVASGSRSIAPSTSTTYTGSVSGPGGTSSCSATVTITTVADIIPPVVTMTAPAGNVSGTSVTVSATATDNVGVAGVQFKLDGVNLGSEDTTGSSYSVTWNSTTASNGSHVLTAVARDAAGNVTVSAPRTVSVSNTYPAPSASPVPGSYTSVQNVSLSASGANSIRYTTTGTTASCTTGSPYINPITVATTQTIRAVACYAGGSSAVASFAYTINLGDTQDPVVSMTAPAGNVSGTSVTVSATATDNVGVAGVQFKLDGVNLGSEDTTGSSYSVTWNSTTASNGSHVLTAVARDAAGNVTVSAPRTVSVSNTYPAPSASPVPGSYTSVQNVSLSASGANSIRYTTTGTTASCTTGSPYINPITVATTQTIRAVACYAGGSSAVASFAYTINLGDTQDPVVSMTAPAGNVSGTSVTVSATATDNVGVAGVQFKLDGVNLGSEDTTGSSYSVTWNSTTASNGSHVLTAVARDAAGNVTVSAPRTVSVANTTGGISAEERALNAFGDRWSLARYNPSLKLLAGGGCYRKTTNSGIDWHLGSDRRSFYNTIDTVFTHAGCASLISTFNDNDVFTTTASSTQLKTHVAEVKSANPSSKFIGYGTLHQYQSGLVGFADICKNHKDWFVYNIGFSGDPTDTRPCNAQNIPSIMQNVVRLHGSAAIDLTKPAVQDYLVSHIIDSLDYFGMDGFLIDGVNYDIRNYFERTDPKKDLIPPAVVAGWDDGWIALVNKLKAADSSKIVFANIQRATADANAFADRILPAVDGIMLEDTFGRIGTNLGNPLTSGYGGGNVARLQSIFDSAAARGKWIIITSNTCLNQTPRCAQPGSFAGTNSVQERAWQRYYLSAYYIFQKGSKWLFYHNPPTPDVPQYGATPFFKDWNINLGSPNPSYTRPASDVFRRQYQNGVVYLNNSSASYTITLSAPLYTPEGTAVTSYTMPPNTGIMLLNAGVISGT